MNFSFVLFVLDEVGMHERAEVTLRLEDAINLLTYNLIKREMLPAFVESRC